MNLQQAVQPKLSANGFGRRRGEREVGTRTESKSQSGKSNPSRSTNTGAMAGYKIGGYGSPSRDRLVYVTTCLIGHHVEVQVKDGSIYSGIFHATNAAEKDFGITLKMAHLIKDGSLRGQRAAADSVSKAPLKILIIPAKELVQVSAKGVAVTKEELSQEFQRERQQELMLDSNISQSRHVELERELKPWVPDENYPECPELDNIFDGPWNRDWNQFETNKALFGVTSTFDEELYTTKLERGPKTEELEKKASRIAREIEGDETQDLHLAEERGIHFHEDFDIDEETKFSSVYRGKGVDDSGYGDIEDILSDSHNTETFGSLSIEKNNDGARLSSSFCSKDQAQSSQSSTGLDLTHTGSYDHAKQLASEFLFKSVPASDSENRIQENSISDQHGLNNNAKELAEKKTLAEDSQLSKPEDSQSSLNEKKDSSDKGGISANATSYATSCGILSKSHEKTSYGEPSDGVASSKVHGEPQSLHSRGRPGSSASSSSDYAGGVSASSGPGLSPSSSMGSLSSEKSTLNPHAKEFKLNPNAKSFIPSQIPVRPQSPVSDGSFYYPPNVSAVPHMSGMPVGIGIGPSFPGHQPVIYPQVPPTPQPYFHANGPQYPPMLLGGHPRQVLYMQNYPHEMQYKGREY